MKPGEKYLSGFLDMGVLGRVKIMAFPNDSDGEDDPDFSLVRATEEGEDNVQAGVLWLNEKQEQEDKQKDVGGSDAEAFM